MIKPMVKHDSDTNTEGEQTPNVASDWLVLLLRIREVSGSNLGPETGYPD
jgi:hypothetical protein